MQLCQYGHVVLNKKKTLMPAYAHVSQDAESWTAPLGVWSQTFPWQEDMWQWLLLKKPLQPDPGHHF